MNNIKITYDIGPVEDDIEVVGSFNFQTNNADDVFIVNALKKSITKLKLTNQKMIVGLFDIFINDIKTHEVGIMGINKLIKYEIRKL